MTSQRKGAYLALCQLILETKQVVQESFNEKAVHF